MNRAISPKEGTINNNLRKRLYQMIEKIRAALAGAFMSMMGILAVVIIVPGVVLLVLGVAVIYGGVTIAVFIAEGDWEESMRFSRNIFHRAYKGHS